MQQRREAAICRTNKISGPGVGYRGGTLLTNSLLNLLKNAYHTPNINNDMGSRHVFHDLTANQKKLLLLVICQLC